jgi:mono/diheme cytochrome c family protein
MMARAFLLAVLCWGCAAAVAAHNIGVTPITWNREISRLVYDKCASCHRPGGSAFSLITYRDVQPRVTEIKAAVLSRHMPPWGAIKGFGDFRNDQALTPEQIELLVDWIQNDAPRGNNRQALPGAPTFAAPTVYRPPARVVQVSGSVTLREPMALDGLMPREVPPNQSMRITASLPDGTVQPLLWLHEYDERYQHAFLFRKVIQLPAGTIVRGVSPGAVIDLLPAAR